MKGEDKFQELEAGCLGVEQASWEAGRAMWLGLEQASQEAGSAVSGYGRPPVAPVRARL